MINLFLSFICLQTQPQFVDLIGRILFIHPNPVSLKVGTCMYMYMHVCIKNLYSELNYFLT